MLFWSGGIACDCHVTMTRAGGKGRQPMSCTSRLLILVCDPEICSVGSHVMVEDTVVDHMVAKIQERITTPARGRLSGHGKVDLTAHQDVEATW